MHQVKKTKRPLILAVETSGRAGSLAIGIGKDILGRQAFSGPMRHSAELFPAVLQLLKQIDKQFSEIGQVYISAGPGSFTGIRIAVTFAKTMHLAGETRIVAVNTMQVIAENTAEYMKEKQIKIEKTATILDAKRGQFYIAMFERHNGQWNRCLPDCLMKPEEFIKQFAKTEQSVWLLGEGLVYYSDAFKAEGIKIIEADYWPANAGNLYKLGWEMAQAEQFTDPVTLVPLYLRGPDVKEKSKG